MGKEPHLLDKVRASIRAKRLSDHTEQSYVQWIRRFIQFHQKRHPNKMGKIEIEMYLTHLAVNRKASVFTQNQALSALLYLYREVLDKDIPRIENVTPVEDPNRMLVSLTIAEAFALLSQLRGERWIMASLLYGSGLRLAECLCLRVHDIDFERRQIMIRDGKDGSERATILPEPLIGPLKHQISQVRIIHEKDMHGGFGEAYLPVDLERKYPSSARALGRQYLFPAENISLDPRSGKYQRYHVAKDVLQQAVQQAGKDARISKPVNCQTLRYSYASHLLERGQDIHTIQELLGQKDMRMAQIYDHVNLHGGLGELSPLEQPHY